MEIKCLYSEVLPIAQLKEKFHDKNRNFHPSEQIERLAKILNYQGARLPAKISNLSGKITAGHGRILAAEKAGWSVYPVEYQDYADEAQEIADLTADNAISDWSHLDLAGINCDIVDLGPDFEIDLLGLKEFSVDLSDKLDLDEEPQEEQGKKYVIEVTFPNDMEMMDIHDDLVHRGYIVKIK
jgi:hypothetical protein